jgi:tetratricopeptide (TPR) repeat protein
VRSVLPLLAIDPAILLALGLAGLVAVSGSRRGSWVLGAYIALSAVSVAIFFVASRYRLPMQVALTIPAGGAGAWLWTRVRAREWASVMSTLGAVALVWAGASWPLGLDDGRAEERVRMGLVEIQNGRWAEGEAWLRRGLPRHGTPGVVHLRAAQVYETLNRSDDAIAHYQAAVAIDPDEPAVRFGLGRALFAAARDEAAIAELARARSLDATREPATQLLVLAETRRGRTEEATRLARDLSPGTWNADEARRFATAITDFGRADLGVPAWRRAAEVGGDARDYERLGISLATVGRHAEALPAFDEAIKRSPGSASMRLNRAVALPAPARPPPPRLEAQAALAVDPNYAKAREFLDAIK